MRIVVGAGKRMMNGQISTNDDPQRMTTVHTVNGVELLPHSLLSIPPHHHSVDSWLLLPAAAHLPTAASALYLRGVDGCVLLLLLLMMIIICNNNTTTTTAPASCSVVVLAFIHQSKSPKSVRQQTIDFLFILPLPSARRCRGSLQNIFAAAAD